MRGNTSGLGVTRPTVQEVFAGAYVALFYYDDLPQDEIARLLDCSVGTVKSQLSKARTTLALALAKEDVS